MMTRREAVRSGLHPRSTGLPTNWRAGLLGQVRLFGGLGSGLRSVCVDLEYVRHPEETPPFGGGTTMFQSPNCSVPQHKRMAVKTARR